MKQSELKKQLKKEHKEKLKKFNEFWENFHKESRVYKNLICKNIKYTISGEINGMWGRCWYCDKCGRNGTNWDKNSIRKIDTLIEEKCDLIEG